MSGNRIPRKFNKIIVKDLIGTSAGTIGDTYEIVKNEFNDYIGTNTRTNKQYNFFVSMLRLSDVFQILEIQ